MKECPSCKTKVDEKNKFCTNCGASLTEVKKEEIKEEVKVVVQQPTTEENKGKGVATASLILGIVSLVLSFVTWLFFPAIILFITIPLGIILGIVGLLQGSKKWGGIILNGISIITGIASAVIVVFLASLLGFSFINEIIDEQLTTRTIRPITTVQTNPVSGFYKCSSSSDVSKDNYTMNIDLWTSKSFNWKAVDNSMTIKGKYEFEEIQKDTEIPNTKYYKITMNADTITQNGKTIDGTKENVYEAGITTSGGKKTMVMMNERTYNLYYCIES